MLEFVSFSLVFLSSVIYRLTKDVFHPAFIVSGLWAILLLLYLFCDHPLYDLSNKFFSALLLWILSFVLFSYFYGSKVFKINWSNIYYPLNTKFFNKLFPFVIVYGVIFICSIIYYAGGVSFVDIRYLLLNQTFSPFFSLLFYLNSLVIIYAFWGILNLDFLSKKRVLIVITLVLLISIFKSNKTSFLAFFVGLMYCLQKNKKLKIRHILFAVIVLGVLISVSTINRRDFDFSNENGLVNYLYIYLLSPLTAFDTLLNGEVFLEPGTKGSGTFTFFYKIINTFGGNIKIADLGTYIFVPLPTNVYTTMRGFYLDYGYWGIFLFGSILGIIWGILYRLQKDGNKVYILFYASMVSSLFFQSFGDYFFYTLSMTIQYFIFAIIISRGLKWKRL